jgi:hypothetical protein
VSPELQARRSRRSAHITPTDRNDELIAKAHRAQADALEIEAMAKRRLADEYDAAQLRGEVRKDGGDQSSAREDCISRHCQPDASALEAGEEPTRKRPWSIA